MLANDYEFPLLASPRQFWAFSWGFERLQHTERRGTLVPNQGNLFATKLRRWVNSRGSLFTFREDYYVYAFGVSSFAVQSKKYLRLEP